MKQCFNRIFFVINILIFLSLLILMSDADLRIARLVVGPDNQWPGLSHAPWTFLYTLAPIPGFLLAAGAGIVLLAGFFRFSLRKFRRQSLFILLLLALGPGLVVNVILKDHLGRPRPQDLIEFGGNHQFVQFWQPGSTEKNSSFPSGHAAIAFFLMAPWFVYRRKNRCKALSFLWTGLLFGLLVGVARIMQGGHFLSDILWAGGLVYIIGELLSCFFHFTASDLPESARI
jgi:membrane-associated PAP2 superfamily phosphatase